MAYATNRDRSPTELEISRSPYPEPPLNVFLRGGSRPGEFHLSWDDPTLLSVNSRFFLYGVNVYRAENEYGPFKRLTEFPLGSTYWVDHTDNEVVIEEDVTNQFILFGECTGSGLDAPRYLFRTLNYPIVKENSQQVFANSPFDVVVKVDGALARVNHVYGQFGEVEIDPSIFPNVATQTNYPVVAPTPTSKVTCSYRYTRSLLRTDLLQRVFYRFTAIGIPVDRDLSVCQPQDLIETPLEHAATTNTEEIEKLDWIWTETIRRNGFILTQGGERVRVYLRKTSGIICPCIADPYHKQPINDCPICFGTSYVGGFDGPYETMIAPDDGDRRISQKDLGRTVEHSYDVWTGPHPQLSMRDFILKQNGERYSIGAVRRPSNRGMLLQQHFTINHIDEKDIRYRVPIDNPAKYAAIEFVPRGPEYEAEAEPTDKPEIPDEQQLKGRTPAWENTEY